MDTNSFNAGMAGILATAGSVGISLLPAIETWLRLGSLCIGIVVGIASLAVIIRNWNKNKN
jgi:phage-related minor tail protein